MLTEEIINKYRENGYIQFTDIVADPNLCADLVKHVYFVNENLKHRSVYRFGDKDQVCKIRGRSLL